MTGLQQHTDSVDMEFKSPGPSQEVVAHVFNPSAEEAEAEAEGSLSSRQNWSTEQFQETLS